MKVLMINSVCGIRSTGRICSDLADLLTERGHICKIAYGREDVPEKYKDYAVRIGGDLDVKLHGIKARLFDASGYGSCAATKRFIEWIKEFSPDVIHLHNIHGYYVNIEMLLKFLGEYGRPVVWTLHDVWSFTGHCSYFADCKKWKTGCGSCPKKGAYPTSYIDRSRSNYKKKKELFCRADNMTLVTPSRWLADCVGESFLAGFDTEVIHNGVDTTVFRPTESDFRERYGLGDKKIILGVASAWGRSKGLYDFARLSEMLDSSYQIVMVGVTEEQARELPDNIIKIIRTNNVEELAKIYTAADVFLNLTYNDNYPTVNIEAQVCGTPAITYRTGGSVESVAEDCIVEQGDLDGVVKLLSQRLEAKNDPTFDKRNMIEEYIHLYERVGSKVK